jgi:hypothetical protein
VENSRFNREIYKPGKALARGVGMAGAPVFVPQPTAFGAAGEAQGQQNETQNRGKALAHGGTLAHRQASRERPARSIKTPGAFAPANN